MGESEDVDVLMTQYKEFADYYERVGNESKALTYYKKYLKATQARDSSQSPTDKIYLERINTIHHHERAFEAERQRMRMKQVVTGAGCILLLIIAGAAVLRWRNRQRIATMSMQLEAERNERRLLAMSMHNEETERLLDYVKGETERLRREGTAQSRDMSRIETNLKLHMAGKNEKVTFEEAFATVSPEFSRRLKEIAPTLTATNIRLCTYIYMGLTSQEIAGLMHVTDNGLRVARFRLRKKLGVPADVTLEGFLQTLG